MNDYNNFVPDVTFEKIPIKNLVSNQDYQRNLSRKHIERAAENFDIYQINPVKVSRRDGINYVFNGQHTIEIVALISGSRETPVWCMVYDDLQYTHEADIFANQMKFVKPLNPYEVFMANIEAENENQLVIRDVVNSFGLTISSKKVPGSICAVSSLENIFNKYGYHVLNKMLMLIIGAWEGDMNSFSANMMNAVAKVIVVYGDDLDEENFVNKLGAVSIKQLTRTAKDRRPGSMGYAEAIILEYNSKMKKGSPRRLRINKLYAKENTLLEGLDNSDESYSYEDDFDYDDYEDEIDQDSLFE